MGDIHQLVLKHGKQAARDMVAPSQRRLVEIASEVLADEAQRMGITYSGFCLTGFPHKKLPDDAAWEKTGHNVTLLVEPGRLKTGPGPAQLVGVPFGARARIIMIYLQTQSIRTGSREVQLGRSMRDWMGRMGLAVGGETARALRDQARRISACHIRFFWSAIDGDGRRGDGFSNGSIVRDGLFFREESDDQGALFEDTVTLDEAFFTVLRSHPVPLLESAIRQLKEKSLALDIYIWLGLTGYIRSAARRAFPGLLCLRSSEPGFGWLVSLGLISWNPLGLHSLLTQMPESRSKQMASACTHPVHRLRSLAKGCVSRPHGAQQPSTA